MHENVYFCSCFALWEIPFDFLLSKNQILLSYDFSIALFYGIITTYYLKLGFFVIPLILKKGVCENKKEDTGIHSYREYGFELPQPDFCFDG